MILIATYKCPNDGAIYFLYGRPIEEGSQVMQNILWPARAGVAPPETNLNIMICPLDGETLSRE